MATPRRLKSVGPNPGRTVLYLRVSKLAGRGGEDFHSPELQKSAMRRAIAAAGLLEVATIDCDIDVSGRTFSREGLKQLREMVEKKQVDVVAVYDLSRLGRNTGESLRFIAWLKEHGVSIVSTVEQIADTPEGQFTLGMFLGLAEMYSNQVGRRWSDVIARRADEQGLSHGPPVTGYLKDGRDIIQDPAVGPAVTKAFQDYAAGKKISSICQMLGAARGSSTGRTLVKRMLVNQTYIGMVKALDEWVPGRHEALVERSVWDACQARLAEDAKEPPGIVNPSYSLTGLFYCAHCGRRGAVWPSRNRRNELVVRVWCKQRQESTGRCHGFGVPRIGEVEDEVMVEIGRRALLLEADPSDIAASVSTAALAEAHVERMRKNLATTQNAMGRITEQWALLQMPQAAYELSMERLAKSERELLDQIKAAEAAVNPKPNVEFVGLAKTLAEMWPDPDFDGPSRNRALRELVSGVIIRRADYRSEPVEQRIWVVPR